MLKLEQEKPVFLRHQDLLIWRLIIKNTVVPQYCNLYSDGEHAWGASRSDMERRKSRIQCWLAVGLGESRHVHTIDQPTITDRNFGSATMRNKKW